MRYSLFTRLAFAAAVVLSPATAASQPTARVLRPNGDGTFDVVIGNDTLLAVSTAVMRRALSVRADLDAAKKEIAVKDSMIRAFQNTLAAYDSLRVRQRAYVTAVEEQLSGYMRLADGYKRLANRQEWLAFDGGVGITGGDTKPTLLVGVGVRRVRLWSVLQERNSGAMLGVHLPIF